MNYKSLPANQLTGDRQRTPTCGATMYSQCQRYISTKKITSILHRHEYLKIDTAWSLKDGSRRVFLISLKCRICKFSPTQKVSP